MMILHILAAFILFSLIEADIAVSTTCALEGDFTLLDTDIDENGTVNILDISFVGTANGHIVDPERPSPKDAADINHDGKVDIADIAQVAADYGKKRVNLTGTSIVAQDDVAEVYQTSSFQQMKSYKLNSVVINFGWNKLEKTRGTYDLTYLNKLDAVAKRATDAGLYVIFRSMKWAFKSSAQGQPLPIAYQAWRLDYSMCIGFPAWIPVYGFWDNINDCQQAYVNMMQMLANHYKDNPKIIGFSLLAEPGNDLNFYWTDAVRDKVCSVMFAPTRLWKRTIDAIHSANPNAIVIFEGYSGRWFSTSNGAMVEKPDSPNIYAGQSVYSDSDGLSSNYPLITQTWNIPYRLTEVGIDLGDPVRPIPQGNLDWLDRTLNYCSQNNIGWTHWNWGGGYSTPEVKTILARYGVG